MKKEKIAQVLDFMAGSIDNKNIELYKKLTEGIHQEEINDVEDFYFALIYPHENFIDGLVQTEISKNNDVRFIMKNSRFIENHFVYWIEKIEGHACSADKSRTILRRLVDFYKNDNRIEFDYTQEYTFHLPTTIFKTHESIIEFYMGLKALRYGNPTKYLISLQALISLQQKNNK